MGYVKFLFQTSRGHSDFHHTKVNFGVDGLIEFVRFICIDENRLLTLQRCWITGNNSTNDGTISKLIMVL